MIITACIKACLHYLHPECREAGCSPLSVSLISDLFSEGRRGLATGIFHWGIYVGYGASYAMGVYTTQADILGYGWRACYIIAGAPGIVLGVLLLITKDQTRGTLIADQQNEGNDEKIALKHDNIDLAVASAEGSHLCNTFRAFCQPVVLALFLAAAFRHSGMGINPQTPLKISLITSLIFQLDLLSHITQGSTFKPIFRWWMWALGCLGYPSSVVPLVWSWEGSFRTGLCKNSACLQDSGFLEPFWLEHIIRHENIFITFLLLAFYYLIF